jgi:X-Pro dipeptidyl-peptidase
MGHIVASLGAGVSRRGRLVAALAMAIAAAAVPIAAHAAPAPDAGRAFVPRPVSQKLYDIKAPSEDPATQRQNVRAADGVNLFVETWLPKQREGYTPPSKVPTILLLTPYASQRLSDDQGVAPRFVPYGYALSVAHVRGTGSSGGCLLIGGAQEADDGARIVEYLGRDAPWSNGNVGMFGGSYDGGTQIQIAALGDPRRTRYLKAIIPAAAVTSWYEVLDFDGVPYFVWPVGVAGRYYATSALLGRQPALNDQSDKPECWDEHARATADPSGNFLDWHRERDFRPGAGNIRAATLVAHGHADDNVPANAMAAFFDRLPKATPRAAVAGVWDHNLPNSHPRLAAEWERADWPAMEIAWYDRYLKGLDTGVEDWPRAQVQGTDGQWRAEPEWPTTGGPAGQLGLGAGRLGATEPTGSTSYTELREATFENAHTGPPPGSFAAFETEPLADRLELSGQPMLDVWVSLDKPDAHLAARIEALDADGRRIENAWAVGFRSMRHLDPFVDGRFVQGQEKEPPTGAPIRVSLRFNPTSLVVPKGGRLRLTVAGSVIRNKGLGEAPEEFSPVGVPAGTTAVEGPSQPSGETTRVTIHHDCAHPSALRFVMPRERAELLNVREEDEPADQPLADNRSAPAAISDAGGLATARVCGNAPERNEILGPKRDAGATVGGTAAKPPRSRARLVVSVKPRRARSRQMVRYAVRVTAEGRPVRGARVKIGLSRATTNARGVARLAARLYRGGPRRVVATKRGFKPGGASIAVRPVRQERSPH